MSDMTARAMADEANRKVQENAAQLAETGKQIRKFTEVNSNTKRGFISIIIDDGHELFLSRQKPIFDAKGIKCDLAINPGIIGQSPRMTWPQIKSLKLEGYGIVNHGYKHQSPHTITDEQLQVNFELEKAEFAANGIETYEYYVYPGTQPIGDGNLKNRLKKFYKCSYANSDSWSGQGIPFDNFDIKREAIYATSAKVTEYIKSSMENKGYCVVFGHAQDVGFTPEVLENILTYIQSNGYGVIGVKEMIDRFGNVIELGSNPNGVQLLVDKNGNTNLSKDKQDQNIINSPINYNQSIVNYTQNTITTFYALGVSTYPEEIFKTGGVVTTYRLTDDRFSYQIATYLTNEKVLIRHWDKTNNSWLPFMEVNKPGIFIQPYTVQYNSSWTLNNFDSNRLTITEVSYSVAVSMGLPETGTIKTFRSAPGRERYSYEEYERFNKVETWKRRWDATNNIWKAWVKVFTEV